MKEFIIAHNEVFVKFGDKTLYEKSNLNLRKFLSKDFDIKVEDVGGGYPEELAKKIVRMASIDWGKEDLKVAIYDDIYLEATKTILDNYNINDTSLYYICSNSKAGGLKEQGFAPSEFAPDGARAVGLVGGKSLRNKEISIPLLSRLMIFRGGRLTIASRVLPTRSSGLYHLAIPDRI